MADEYDADAAQSEFSGFIDDLRTVIKELEGDYETYKNHKPESESEERQYKEGLRTRLTGSRSLLTKLIEAI